MTRIIYTDGLTTKNFDRAIKYPDEAWTFITEPPEASETELYATVAALFRAANLCADAIANLPFALVNRRGNDYDTSEDWQNKIGFMPDPQELFRLWRLSLYCTNTAYGFMETTSGKSNLRYIVPTSITPVQNRSFPYELTGFKRTVGSSTIEYPIEEKRIFYIWRLDHTTELLPTKNSEFKAAATAAGVVYFSDYYIRNFFARGGIKPTMLLVKGAVNPGERDKLENIWDKVIRGYYKYLGKIFNAEAVEPLVIGEGIESLKDDLIYRNKLSDIAMASGIPLSLLLANSASYATAQTEYLTWFRDSVTPWANFMAKQINDQLLAPYGLRLDFRPEITDPGQESEVARADAYASYVGSGMKPSIAAQVVGIDLPPGVEYEALDPDEAEIVQPIEQTPQEEEPQKEEESQPPAKFIPTMEQYRELDFWQTLAFRKAKKGEAADFDFRYKVIPAEVVDAIKNRLAGAKTDDEIRNAFSLDEAPDEKAIVELAASINRAADAIYKTLEQTSIKYDDSQPREPAGSPNGGQWTSTRRYFRYTHSDESPMSEWGHAMFADDIEKVTGHDSYGKIAWTYDTTEGKTIGGNELAELARKELTALKEEEYSAAYYDFWEALNNPDYTIDDWVDKFLPDDIVDSAGIYDYGDAINWLGEEIINKHGIDVILTPDGAVVFNPDLIKRYSEGDW